MNCTELEIVLFQIADYDNNSIQNPLLVYLIPSSIMGVSCIILIIGAKISKIIASGIFGIAGAVAVFFILNSIEQVTCQIRLISSGIVGILAAAIASCLLKTSFFVIGAAAAGFLTHTIFETWPHLHTLIDWPEFQGKSALYWISIIFASVLTGSIVRYKYKKLLVLLSALLGAIGFTYGLYTLLKAFSCIIPIWSLYVIGSVLCLSSTYLQTYKPLCKKITIRKVPSKFDA